MTEGKGDRPQPTSGRDNGNTATSLRLAESAGLHDMPKPQVRSSDNVKVAQNDSVRSDGQREKYPTANRDKKGDREGVKTHDPVMSQFPDADKLLPPELQKGKGKGDPTRRDSGQTPADSTRKQDGKSATLDFTPGPQNKDAPRREAGAPPGAPNETRTGAAKPDTLPNNPADIKDKKNSGAPQTGRDAKVGQPQTNSGVPSENSKDLPWKEFLAKAQQAKEGTRTKYRRPFGKWQNRSFSERVLRHGIQTQTTIWRWFADSDRGAAESVLPSNARHDQRW